VDVSAAGSTRWQPKQQGRSRFSRPFDEQGVAEQLVAQARQKGIQLVDPEGLLSQLTRRVLETALEAGMPAVSSPFAVQNVSEHHEYYEAVAAA
jgi:hypothetical protein